MQLDYKFTMICKNCNPFFETVELVAFTDEFCQYLNDNWFDTKQPIQKKQVYTISKVVYQAIETELKKQPFMGTVGCRWE